MNDEPKAIDTIIEALTPLDIDARNRVAAHMQAWVHSINNKEFAEAQKAKANRELAESKKSEDAEAK